MVADQQPAPRLRLFLRDFRVIEAHISLAEGQSLTQYFVSRKHYVNLRGAKWSGAGQTIDHVVMKVEQVLWAAALDGDIALTQATSPAAPRVVEVQLDGGLLIRASMFLSDGQRLSDYLEAQPQFIPMRDVELLRSGRPPQAVNVTLGDIALNQAGVQAMWEADLSRTERAP